MIRVVLADDEAMIRAGVRSILSADPEIEVVAEAADGRAAVDLVARHRPDVALLDIRMPKLDGLAAVSEIRTIAPETAIGILTTFGEDEYIGRALGDGAAGFLLKAADPRELIAGVRALAEGAGYLSPRVARRVIAEMRGNRMTRGSAAAERVAELTDRERETLAMLASGLSNAEIARQMFVVEGTVKGYVSTVLKRLGVTNRVQAALVAYDAGLVRDTES